MIRPLPQAASNSSYLTCPGFQWRSISTALSTCCPSLPTLYQHLNQPQPNLYALCFHPYTSAFYLWPSFDRFPPSKTFSRSLGIISYLHLRYRDTPPSIWKKVLYHRIRPFATDPWRLAFSFSFIMRLPFLGISLISAHYLDISLYSNSNMFPPPPLLDYSSASASQIMIQYNISYVSSTVGTIG